MKDFKVKNGTLTTKIYDEESDLLKCSFNNDNCVQINTEGYSYITLSIENLEKLKKLIEKAEKYYDENL